MFVKQPNPKNRGVCIMHVVTFSKIKLADPYQIQNVVCPRRGPKGPHSNHSMRRRAQEEQGGARVSRKVLWKHRPPRGLRRSGRRTWERRWLSHFIPCPGDSPSPGPWISFATRFLRKVLWARVHHPWLAQKPLLPEPQGPFLGAPSPSTNKTRARRSLHHTLLGKIGLINLVWPLSLGDRENGV